MSSFTPSSGRDSEAAAQGRSEHPLDRIERKLDLVTEKARRLEQQHRDVPVDSLIRDLEMIARMLGAL